MKTDEQIRKIDSDGLLLCKLQAESFEASFESTKMSSEIFIRRFMNSQIAIYMDSTDFLQMNLQAKDVIDRVEEEYGVSSYGSIKYSKNELYWIGYVYRFFSFTYELSTLQVYKLVKPKELRELFLPYHTMDPSQAIERILEAKGLFQNEEKELQRQFEIYKKIRFII